MFKEQRKLFQMFVDAYCLSISSTNPRDNLREPEDNFHEPEYNILEPKDNLHEAENNLHEPEDNLYEPVTFSQTQLGKNCSPKSLPDFKRIYLIIYGSGSLKLREVLQI